MFAKARCGSCAVQQRDGSTARDVLSGPQNWASASCVGTAHMGTLYLGLPDHPYSPSPAMQTALSAPKPV